MTAPTPTKTPIAANGVISEDRLSEILKSHIQGDPRNKTFEDMLKDCNHWDILEAMKEACVEYAKHSKEAENAFYAGNKMEPGSDTYGVHFTYSDYQDYLNNEKIYFTKYLPVDGELKAGDKVKSGLRIYTLSEKLDDGRWKVKGTNLIIISNAVKVELFLCSRGIKAGDKVWWNPKKGETKSREAEVLSIDRVTNIATLDIPEREAPFEYKLENLFKVVRVVLDKNIREGSEFAENELSRYFK